MFDCAFKPAKGERSIHWMGHIRMMGATQPFLSGAISQDGEHARRDATVEDIEEAYLEAWKLGLKAVAVYRDGCKRSQPLNTSKKKEEAAKAVAAAPPVEAEPERVRAAAAGRAASPSPTSSPSAATRAT